MSTFQIKLFACFFMLIDHMGVILFPQYLVLRILGRVSFPLFAWLIATGYLHTRSVSHYLQRLLVFAIALQIPYTIYFKSLDLNIFFTLFLGLLSIYLNDHAKKSTVGFCAVFLVAAFGTAINADYGAYGVLTIFLFYYFYRNMEKLVLSQIILNLGTFIYSFVLLLIIKPESFPTIQFIQPFSVMALFFVAAYNGMKGRSMKYVFYLFFPVHLVLLWGIKLLVQA